MKFAVAIFCLLSGGSAFATLTDGSGDGQKPPVHAEAQTANNLLIIDAGTMDCFFKARQGIGSKDLKELVFQQCRRNLLKSSQNVSPKKVADFLSDEQDCHFRSFGSSVLGISGAIGSDRMKTLLKANCLRLRGYSVRVGENLAPADADKASAELKSAFSSLGDSKNDLALKEQIRATLENIAGQRSSPKIKSAELNSQVVR